MRMPAVASKIDPQNIRSILVVRNDRIGEFLLNIPAFRALQETFPCARLTCVIDPYLEPLMPYVPFIDDFLIWKNSRHTFKDMLAMAVRLRRRRFDMAVILNPTKEMNILSFAAGIPIRCGYRRKLAFLLTDTIPDDKLQNPLHEVEHNLKLVNTVGAKTRDTSVCLKTESLPRSSGPGSGLRKPYIIVHPWASREDKIWPLHNMLELVRVCCRSRNEQIVIIGGPADQEASRMFEGIAHNIINLTGKTNIPELLEVVSGASLVVSNDSGPMHIAAALGRPVIALFRNDLAGRTPHRWGPWGRGHTIIQKSSLEDITVEEVFQAIGKALGSAHAKSI